MKGKIFVSVLCLLALSACAGRINTQPVVVKRQYEAVPIFNPPAPEPVKMRQIHWKVMTPDIAQTWINDIKTEQAPEEVWYSVSPKNYEILSNNIAELKRYIKQQKAIIEYYQKNAKSMSASTTDVPGMAKSEVMAQQ